MRVQLEDTYEGLLCNPYATDFMTGVDPRTPPGYVDVYIEYVYTAKLPAPGPNPKQILYDKLTFDDDFLIRLIKGNSPSGNLQDVYLKIMGPDGEYLMDNPVQVQILIGLCQFPMPVPDWFIPVGKYIEIESYIA